MRIALSLLLISTLALAACQSRWNPVNWFGGSEEIATSENANPLIPNAKAEKEGVFGKKPEPVYNGTPIYQIKSLQIHRVPEGAMIVAIGVSAVHGANAAKLTPRNDGKPEGGVLSYDLLAIQPQGGFTGGSEESREVSVAHVLTTQQLEGVRTIKVFGTSNARQARR